MSAKKTDEKVSFWNKYKILLIGLVGSVLLIGSLSVQNIVLVYRPAKGEQMAVKLDYSAFTMCLRCYSATDNAKDIVIEDVFAGIGRKKSLKRAASAMQRMAKNEEGQFYLDVNGLLGSNEKTTAALVDFLKEEGFEAAAAESLSEE